MISPIRLTCGVNNKIIFTRIKKIPITTKQKTKTANPKTNLNKFSLFIYFNKYLTIHKRSSRHSADQLSFLSYPDSSPLIIALNYEFVYHNRYSD